MGIREKLRRGVKKRVQRGRKKARSKQESEAMQRRRARIRKARELASRAGGAVATGIEEAEVRATDDQARDQFERAQRTAQVGPVIDATLDPMGSPERIEATATGGRPREESRVDDLVTGGGEAGGMEELVLGTVSRAERRNLDRAEAQGPTVDALVPGVGPADADGEPGLLTWGDENG